MSQYYVAVVRETVNVKTCCHSLEELDADLLVGDGRGPQQQQGGAEGMGDAITKQLYSRHCQGGRGLSLKVG